MSAKFYQLASSLNVYPDNVKMLEQFNDLDYANPLYAGFIEYIELKSTKGNHKIPDILDSFGLSGILISSRLLDLIKIHNKFNYKTNVVNILFKRKYYKFYNLKMEEDKFSEIFNVHKFILHDKFDNGVEISRKDIDYCLGNSKFVTNYIANLNKLGYRVGLHCISIFQKFELYEIFPFDNNTILISENFKIILEKYKMLGLKFTEQCALSNQN